MNESSKQSTYPLESSNDLNFINFCDSESDSFNAVDEDRLPSEASVAVNNPIFTGGVNNSFRGVRTLATYGTSSSAIHATNSSMRTDDANQNDALVPEVRRYVPASSEGQNLLDDNDTNRFDVVEDFLTDADALTISGTLVTAELVHDEGMLDQNERRRIEEETMQSIFNQAVTAKAMHQNNIRFSLRCTAFSMILILVLTMFATVLVVVLKARNTKHIVLAPTHSPTIFLDDSVFRTTEELYEAVDTYRILTWNASDQSLFETSDVALRYGFPISSWNVSLITNFSYVFDATRFAPEIPWKFNENLGDWDVSNANAMVGMFRNSVEFQGIGLENWNVSKVKDFSHMFYFSGVNGTISGWDTSRAELMDSMLSLTKFNGDLSLWDVSRVRSMKAMFANADAFEGNGLENWNVQNVRDFSSMFDGAKVFNGTIGGWKTSSAETMERMFSYASIFNGDLGSWDVSNVVDMDLMFHYAEEYTGDGIAAWDVRKVTSMDSLFSAAILFNGNISAWNVSSVNSIFGLFASAYSFNGDVSNWDVSNVLDFTATFSYCSEFNGNLSSWNTISANYMSEMFNGAKKFQGHGLSNWNTAVVISLDLMFQDAISFIGDLSSWDVGNVRTMNSMVRMSVDFVIASLFKILTGAFIFSSRSFERHSLMVPQLSMVIFHNGTSPMWLMQAICFTRLLPSMVIYRDGMFRRWGMQVICLARLRLLTKAFVRGEIFFRQMYRWIAFSLSPVATLD